MTRDDIIRMAREVDLHERVKDGVGYVVRIPNLEKLQRFAALVAAAEQKPISDVTEAVTKTVIEVEKLLCEKIGRQWQPSGMSIQTLVDELAALVAEREREACAKVCEEKQSYFTPIPCPDGISGCLVAHHGPVQRKKTATECAAAIRARGET